MNAPEQAAPRRPHVVPLADADRDLLLDPPLQTLDVPGIGGRIRARPEDFVVREIPAYPPDGREGAHLLLVLRKRSIGTEEALREVAAQCRIPRPEIGLAGLKDHDALTEQWITVPAAFRGALAAFAHPAITLGEPHPHGNKLRRGHLHGNAFEITVRDLAVPPAEALARITAKLAALRDRGGLANLYGDQRFGEDGRNMVRGLALLLGERARDRRKADFLLSAGQSALFNLYLLERRARGLMRTVLAGDILRKRATGGLFQCSDPAVDQARFDAGEVELTGPIFGGKMMAPAPGTPAGDLEAAILARVGVGADALGALGRKIPGTRRPLVLDLGDLQAEPAPEVELASTSPAPHKACLSAGVCLRFRLPAGSYATTLLREIQEPAPSPPPVPSPAPPPSPVPLPPASSSIDP